MEKQRPAAGPARASWSILDPPRYRERFAFAFAVSVYLHGLILLIQFGAAGFGMPWAERRAQGPELSLRLDYAVRPPEPAPVPQQDLFDPPTLPTSEEPKPPMPARADFAFEVRFARAEEAAPPRPAPSSAPKRVTRARAPAAKALARAPKVQTQPQPQLLARSDPQEETFKVPPPKVAEPEPSRAPDSAARKQVEEPAPAGDQAATAQAEEAARAEKEEAARRRAEEAARKRTEEEARQRAAAREKEIEAKKQEEAQRLALEAEARKRAEEAARREAEERERAVALKKEEEAKRLEVARKLEEAQKLEAARIQEELRKKEEARRLALEAEALKRAEELARQQAEARRKEAEAKRVAEEAAARAKEAAAREQAQAQAAGQRERDKLAAEQALKAAPGALSGQELAAKALDQLRKPGAGRDDLLRQPAPPPVLDKPRRYTFVGPERDVGLRMYVDSWRWKIERNGSLNYRASASMRARDNPIVTVAIRSDGSLEDVYIHRSSGVRELDEAIRRIARVNSPYSAFPPALARQYDVIEIRRVWQFEDTLRIMEEMYR